MRRYLLLLYLLGHQNCILPETPAQGVIHTETSLVIVDALSAQEMAGLQEVKDFCYLLTWSVFLSSQGTCSLLSLSRHTRSPLLTDQALSVRGYCNNCRKKSIADMS